ncbi:Delta(24)-sterol reductase [Dinochytrium kinnereticum]|nr:Delta(24)-sterol reductase [Dinochytrium kinnereticum]
MGNSWLFRHTLGWLMPPQVNFLKLTQTQSMKDHYFHKHIAQDYLLPLDKLREGLDLCHEVYEVYPLWLCPHAVLKTEPQGAVRAPANGKDIEQYVDIGVWGVPGPVQRKEYFDAHEANREYETWLRKNAGYQAMYALSEQTKEEFKEMFDMSLYESVRKKYKCEGVFMDVTQKVLSRK